MDGYMYRSGRSVGLMSHGYVSWEVPRRVPLGWKLVLIAIAMWACFAPAVTCLVLDANEYSARRTAAIPLLPGRAMLHEIVEAKRMLLAAQTPEEYLRAARNVVRVDDHFVKYGGASHGRFDLVLQNRMAEGSLRGTLNDTFLRIKNSFGGEAIHEADMKLGGGWQDYTSVDSRAIPTDYPTVLALLIGYLCSLGIAVAFFSMRIRAMGYNLLIEVPNLPFAVLVWPIAMWTYPTPLPALERLERTKRRMAGFITAMLAFAPAGAFAKSSQDKTEHGHDAAQAIVLGEEFVPELSLTTGIESSKVGSNGKVLHYGPVSTWTVNAAFPGGWSLDFAGTKSLSGANSSDEWDLEGFQSGTLSFGPSYTVGLHYYGIRPWRKLIDGNFAAATFSIDEPVGYGVHVFVSGEYDHIISHSREDGYDVQGGVSRGFNLGHNVSFTPSVSLVQAGGPFGLKSVTLGRFDASVAVPLSKAVSASVWGKLFERLAGAAGRHDGAFGVSLSYACN